MPLNVIRTPINISNAGDVLVPPQIAALSNGGYAVTYTSGNAVIDTVFDAQGHPIVNGAVMEGIVEGFPDIAGLSGGGYALAWEDDLAGEIFTAVYNAQGEPLSAAANASNSPAANLSDVLPVVKELPTGGYTLTWQVPATSGNYDILTAIYNAQGQQVVAPINVSNTPDIDDQGAVVAVLTNGNYALTWQSGTLGGDHDIFTAVYAANGQQIAAPLDVTNTNAVSEGDVQVAALSTGGYALSWDSPSDGDIFTAVYDAQGHAVAAPVDVAAGSQPHVAALSNGNYALFWSGAGGDVFTAVYNAQGQQLSAPADVSNVPGLIKDAGQVTALSNGAYAVSWDSQTADGSYDIFTAVYNAQGQQVIAPVDVSNSPGADDLSPEIAALANGAYVLTWLGPSGFVNDAYTAVYQFVDSSTPGDVSVIGSPDIAIDLSALVNVGGSVMVTNNGAAVSIDLTNLASIGGNFVLSDNGAVLTISLPALTSVGGYIDVNGDGTLGSVTLPALTNVGGYVNVSGDGAVGSITLPALTSVGGYIDVNGDGTLGSVTLPALTNVDGYVNVSGDGAVGSITLPALTSVGGYIDVNGDGTLGSVTLPALTNVGGSVDVSGNQTVINIDLGALIQAGAIIIADNGVITLDLSSLVKAGGDVAITNNDSLLTVDMPNLTAVTGDVNVSNNDSATSVAMHALSAAGGNVDINGNTAAGTVDLGNLTSAGGNVDINGNTAAGTVDLGNLTSAGGNVDINGNTAATTIDLGSLDNVAGDVTVAAAPDAKVDASGLGPGGGNVVLIGDITTTVEVGSLANMTGTLTITSADGVTVSAKAGLANISMTGTAGDDVLIGSKMAANTMNGDGGNDSLTGGNADDMLMGGAGNDTLDGKGGTNTAVFSGNFTDYAVVENADGSLTVTDTRANSPDGTDTLRKFELLKFADGTHTLADVLKPPVITSNGGGDNAAISIPENTAAITQIKAIDPNAAQTLVFAIAGGADAAKFQIDPVSGALSFVVAPNFEAPTDAGANNVYDVIVQVSDGFHLVTQALAVTITNVNEAPVVVALNGTIGEDSPSFSRDLLTGASDPDTGDQLSVLGLDASVTTAGGRALALGTDYTLNGSTMALTAAGFAKFNSLSSSETDQAILHFGVSDGTVAIGDTLTLTVIGANDAPSLASQTSNQSATVGTPFSLILPANTFQDPDNGDHLTLIATVSNGTALPAWLTFNPTTGAFSGTAGLADVGAFDVRVSATDPGGLTATDAFHFSVVAPNTDRPPVITSDGGGDAASIVITDDTKYVATVHAVDPDQGTTVAYSIVGGSDQKLFAIDPNTGVLSFKSTPQDGHSYQVTVAASDGNLKDTQAIAVHVANGPLEFSNPGVADTFVFKPHFGLTVVDNFDPTSPNHDVIQFDHALLHNADINASPAATLNLVENHSFQLGHDIVIVTDTHDVIDLRNTNLHSLTAHDFILT
jgi:hypothetical protein